MNCTVSGNRRSGIAVWASEVVWIVGRFGVGRAPFTANMPCDLRGRTVAGQSLYYVFADGIPLDTSEPGPAVVVH